MKKIILAVLLIIASSAAFAQSVSSETKENIKTIAKMFGHKQIKHCSSFGGDKLSTEDSLVFATLAKTQRDQWKQKYPSRDDIFVITLDSKKTYSIEVGNRKKATSFDEVLPNWGSFGHVRMIALASRKKLADRKAFPPRVSQL